MDPLDTLSPSGAYTDIDTLLRLRFAAGELALFARRPSAAVISGQVRTRFRGRGMEFEEVRPYQPGDDIRSIDWRVTARTQAAYTKLYREERERPVFVWVDQRAPMFFGSRGCFKSVLAAHLASLLGWAALNNSDRIGAQVFGDRDHHDIRPRRSKHALLELIHQLHESNHRLHTPVAPAGGKRLEDMLADARRVSKPGSAVFLISDFHDFTRACEEQLFQLARHTDITLFALADPLESRLPDTTRLTVSDGQRRLPVDTADPQLAQAFSQRYQQRRRALQKTCAALAVPLVSVATGDDPVALLRGLYGRKRR
ncbi:DUF58 domain-containing protein [Exilibacterium tricleocarpae]|uniref:DUF58 domain-containing protein n=1 Tax=Exilibacterium tricleocarpae TaxID=2591008 RepID=A0A545TUU8_9GAMM|nr:DUF58 domain-containing protein [Exilibacterium tricleocarpae]TQV80994.1 DUF58 domain-containing protein [Exilibacterium tricleocarpae]